MRQRPAFHEVEPPPVVVSLIDGISDEISDEQWAARNERRATRYRRLVDGVFACSLMGTAIMSLPLWIIPWWVWLVLGIVWALNLALFAAIILSGYLQRPFG